LSEIIREQDQHCRNATSQGHIVDTLGKQNWTRMRHKVIQPLRLIMFLVPKQFANSFKINFHISASFYIKRGTASFYLATQMHQWIHYMQ